jgi:tetratricopeptide (TPR) repeat protein
MAQKLLGLRGMSGSEDNPGIMSAQAQAYRCKSEYSKARDIHHQILQTFSVDWDPYWHACTLLFIAEIELLTGIKTEIVQRNINLAQSIFTNLKLEIWVTSSEAALATLYLREKNCYIAKLLLEKCFAAHLDNQIKTFCLEQLSNVSKWGTGYSMSSWTTIFLVHSLKCRKKLEVHKALQFFREVFLHQKDEDTAITLLTVALEGFTYMDVHQGRAECMSRLGDISKGHGDLLKAVELWNTARPLFERSCQMQEVKHIDERLSSVDNNVRKLEFDSAHSIHFVFLNCLYSKSLTSSGL